MLYGERYIGSNVHDLIHVVDKVRQFGDLTTFSAYEFENMLGKIKLLLRTGSLPLQQVVKRLSEFHSQNSNHGSKKPGSIQHFAKCNADCDEFKQLFPDGSSFYCKLKLDNYILTANNFFNQWFLTHNKEIVKVISFVGFETEKAVYGCALKQSRDIFEYPIRSSYLNVFASDCLEYNSPAVYSIDDIMFKLVPIKHHENTTFIPLLHFDRA